jgi:hypothetical protein
MKTLWLGCLAVLLPFASFGLAQKSARPVEEAKPIDKDAPAAKAGDSNTAVKAEEKDTPRLQKLKQLTYDRRPSAILQAWAPKPPPPLKPDDPKPDPLDKEMEALQHNVTLGHWAEVKKYLAGLPDKEARAGYEHMLRSLQSGPPIGPPQPGMPPMMQYAERNRFSPDDLIGLAAAAPKGLDKDALHGLGAILRQSIAGGTVVESAVSRFKAEVAKPSGAVLTNPQAARLLVESGQAADAGDFLPRLDRARSERDAEALNLLAKYFVGRHERDKKLSDLERAWEATQAALAIPHKKEHRAEQEEALSEAVELAPKLRSELGQKWLEQSFTDKPDRGMDILSTIGALSSRGLTAQPFNPDQRFRSLELLKTAVEALLKAAPERAKEWRDTLTLLGGSWLREGEFSYQHAEGSGSARMNRDVFGNIYFVRYGMMQYQQMNPNQPRPIAVVDVLKARPNPDWLEQMRDDLRPKVAITLCQLHLKADEETKAFPYIEQLASSHPRQARELVKEFLRVWTRNHDPNAARAYTNPYMFMYGFERRAEGIPLTRSKQERNLIDLAGWVKRLYKLPLGDPDEELLAKAFTACHSIAEVYRAEAIEKVFGPIGGLKPKTLAGLIQQMRENLAGIWRKPEEQNAKKTNRKTKDIRAEVLRGYEVANEVVADALKKHPDEWSLILARAAVLHDEANYRQEIKKDSGFSHKIQEAYAEFERAARRYAAIVHDLPEDDQSTKVYEQWMYASLGACDLGEVNEEKVPDPKQAAKIRAAILSLPGETAEKHRAKFANLLFTRLSAVKPAVKYRYLKAGFEIVGDHEQAAEAKKVFDYYKDLVNEIKLETVIDGPAGVGHAQPFGVFVFLRHTREIERESGGFGRYLQNQNSANLMFVYNYGRPTADYRDRFQAAATEALKEHFEILSVTFETDKVHSRATKEYGWRITPYAYLLLKARGPQVDKLPPLRIDLDFLDTSGYTILPVESPALPLDAKPARGEPRPAHKLQITQILDERQAVQGKLILEIKATALGLVPPLDQVLTLKPDGFDIVKTDDQGVSVSKFDPDSEDIAIASERTWLVTLRASPDQAQPPATFHFGQAKVEDATTVYQRFVDADLAAVEAEVPLEQLYGGRPFRWVWWASGAAITLLLLALIAFVLLRRPRARAASRWRIPDPITPFTVLSLLTRIHQDGALTEQQREEVRQSIRRLERHYFAEDANGDGQLDLKKVAEGWLNKLPAD